MMNYGTGFGFGGLWMILFLVLIVVVIAMIVKGTMRAPSSTSSQNETQQTPLQILEQRYARGEMEREEFLQKKHDLE